VGVCCPCGSTVADLPFGQVFEGPPQVLMHIQHDGVAAARVPAHRLFQPVEILLVVLARLWLYSSPGDEKSHEVRAHILVLVLNALLIDVREAVGGGFRPAISRETVQDQCPALRVGDEPGRSVRRRRNTSRHGSRDDEYCDTREKKPNPHYRRSADMVKDHASPTKLSPRYSRIGSSHGGGGRADTTYSTPHPCGPSRDPGSARGPRGNPTHLGPGGGADVVVGSESPRRCADAAYCMAIHGEAARSAALSRALRGYQ